MAITKNEVEYVANLSRLLLDENEVDEYTEKLNSILGFMNKLNELNTDKINPTSHPLDISNVFREDEERESIPNETALKNAPQHKDGQFKVPSVMEG